MAALSVKVTAATLRIATGWSGDVTTAHTRSTSTDVFPVPAPAVTTTVRSTAVRASSRSGASTSPLTPSPPLRWCPALPL